MSADSLSAKEQAGKKLYQQANCIQCHASGLHFGEAARDFPALRGWVKSCTIYFKYDFFPSEETNIALYLNKAYYHYLLDK